MKHFVLLLVVVSLSAWAAAARADWDPNQPTKWVQLPDPDGWDVRLTTPKLLADDFLCTTPGWISDIHFWGSWKNDDVGQINRIHLSIHADVPAGPGGLNYSTPGPELWSLDIDPLNYTGGVVIGPWGTGLQGWYDPNDPDGGVLPQNHNQIWQVNVFLDEKDWFWQEGTRDQPLVYWLDIQVDAVSPDGQTGVVDFGWKTSLDHWNDDAVWGDWDPTGPKPVGDQWYELYDPLGSGTSLDMAFAITTVPEPGMLSIAMAGIAGLLAFRRRK